TSVERNNKTYASAHPVEGASKAVMNYRLLASGDRYHLLEVELLTGRKHQIRAQLAHIGCHIKGDLKYGAARSNPDGGISLQAHRIWFEHPVSHVLVDVTAPLPQEPLWQQLADLASKAEKPES
ncbi:MAG: RNA pseudouridine synthase, partial [Muribaculaceae bacterium]|nr:RNA pseudouridine synthase [Muribaculaceae bacterium]